MIQDLRVSMPANEEIRKKIEGWKKEVSEGADAVSIGNPFYFCTFRDYQAVFRQFRKEGTGNGRSLTLLRVRFEPKDESFRIPNLVSARQFLLTLAENHIPVAASFPDSEFENNLSDLVVKVI
ncbi:hypothetical protein HYT00_03190 [Candidatus Giovannonibacteria bacterium]|nr:hypothetical protein [Candidatus Giovannonibacteria bacterium]